MWNGTDKTYNGKGDGAFCINPKDGLDGIFVGNDSLKAILDGNKKIYGSEDKCDISTLQKMQVIMKDMLVRLGMEVENITF